MVSKPNVGFHPIKLQCSLVEIEEHVSQGDGVAHRRVFTYLLDNDGAQWHGGVQYDACKRDGRLLFRYFYGTV